MATKKIIKNYKINISRNIFLDYPQIRVDDNKNTHSLPLRNFGQMYLKY